MEKTTMSKLLNLSLPKWTICSVRCVRCKLLYPDSLNTICQCFSLSLSLSLPNLIVALRILLLISSDGKTFIKIQNKWRGRKKLKQNSCINNR